MRRIALLLVIAILCSGCSRLLETEFQSIAPHTEASPTVTEDGTQTAKNKAELKSAILRLVRAGSTQGRVLLRNYVGDVDTDVYDTCRTVLRQEPIGSYAVDYLTPEINRLLADYEVNLSLNYRRTNEQVQSVTPISGLQDFRKRLGTALATYSTEFVVETNFYEEGQYAYPNLLQQEYYAQPLTAQGMPELSVTLYPETGPRRIIEVKLSYPDTISALRAQTVACDNEIQSMIAHIARESSKAQQALAAFVLLADKTTFDAEVFQAMTEGQIVDDSLNDVLIDGRGVSQGYALAYKALCDALQIPCRVVVGRRGVDEHFWNVIQLDDAWYHVDVATSDAGEALQYQFFLCDDTVMMLDYRWDVNDTPACTGTLTYERLSQEAQ